MPLIICVITGSSNPLKQKEKKAKASPPLRPLHRWGRPEGVGVGDPGRAKNTKVVHDVDSLALQLQGADPDAVLCPLGFPAGLEYHDDTKLEALGINRDDYASTKEATSAAEKELRRREKSFPAWAFLSFEAMSKTDAKKKHGNLGCVSYDGKTVSTRLLLKKVEVVATESSGFGGAPIKYVITELMTTKAAALLAFAPKINGNGEIIAA